MTKRYEDLSLNDKKQIIDTYYSQKDLKMCEIQNMFNVSKMAFAKIFKEANINTRLKNRYTLNEHYFDLIDTPTKAYFLGLIAADGFVGESNNFAIYSIDKSILIDFKKELSFSGDLTVGCGNFKNSKNGYYLRFSSKQIVESLNKLGITTKKSLTFDKIPNIKEEYKKDFIRGYFDGDGSVTFGYRTYKNKYTYPRLSILIMGVEDLLLEIAKTLNLKSFYIQKSKTPEIKILRINNKQDLIKIYHIFYDDAETYLKRKRDKIEEYMCAINQKWLLQKGLIAGKLHNLLLLLHSSNTYGWTKYNGLGVVKTQ